VYLCVACMGNPADYDTMILLHRSTQIPEEKQRLVRYRYPTLSGSNL